MKQLTIRHLDPKDLPAVRAMFTRLSKRTVYLRFFTVGDGALNAELAYLAALDGHERVALVAEADGAIVGLARFHATGDGRAVAAALVEDGWQRRGIGRRLMSDLVDAARREGMASLDVSVLGDNMAALRLIRHVAPGIRYALDHGVLEGAIPIAA
jgi:GNAT superfamily N-acetyltransferase